MGELSEDSESSARVTASEGGAGGSGQPDRPKLVALPEPAIPPTPAAADAEPGPADAATTVASVANAVADRLTLERSLSGPPLPGPRIDDAPRRAPGTAPAPEPPPAAPDVAARAVEPRPVPAPWASPSSAFSDPITLAATPELVPALRAELAMRAHAEAGLRARAVDAESRLAARLLRSRQTAEALRLVRAELDQLAGLLTDERARRQAAEQRVEALERQLAGDRGRSDDADREIAVLRDSLQQLRSPADGEAAPGEVRADRLNDALTRLRAGTDPIEQPLLPETPDVARQETLAGPFRSLCRRDPALAGQLALSLLPLQWVAYPRPVSYDVVLGPDLGCVQVTSANGGTEVARHATARPLDQVDFHVVGGPERFAKLLAAGRIRRRFGFWVLSRVRGNRGELKALDALLAVALELPALVDGELSTDPLILAQLQAWIKRAQSE